MPRLCHSPPSLSSPRKRGPSSRRGRWVPAFAGMTAVGRPGYSWRSASIGLSEAARRAGK
ncbi:hypothetical protein DBR17_17000 [Sphingomonas sp. HMWF008]|nr:hypothetical protein DBR17_17000 [Sphingomonas sp. HMWF008]